MNKLTLNPEVPSVYPIASLDNLSDPFSHIKNLLSLNARLSLNSQWIQIRSKGIIPSDKLLLFVKNVLKLRNEISPSSKIIVNDYLNIALEAEADGLHLGQSDKPGPLEARKILGNTAIIGLSSHTLTQASNAPFESLSYLATGPVYLSGTKFGHAEVTGISTLTEVRKICPTPLIAIGGISSKNSKEVFTAGADSVAVIGALSSDCYNELSSEYKLLLESKC
ncbi:MAG TPA: thiamine phosphate synthase [Oligoflexia bacterium]|nr:thiamine phosphate synthase [Oligoflexia bacterium]HMP48870.1 thiamine phosphate synthase [Oligoflexia bacterium]